MTRINIGSVAILEFIYIVYLHKKNILVFMIGLLYILFSQIQKQSSGGVL